MYLFENVQKREYFYIVGENLKGCSHWKKKNSMEFPDKIKNVTTIWSSNSIPAVQLKKTKYQFIFLIQLLMYLSNLGKAQIY